jgi:hypothetical protein
MKAVNGGLHHQAQILLVSIFSLWILLVKTDCHYGPHGLISVDGHSPAMAARELLAILPDSYGGAVDTGLGQGIKRK